MATKNETALAKKQAAELAKIQEEYVDKGLDHIGKDDMAMPRLALAQGLSPQMLKNDPSYIEGLTLGDAFNTLTGEIYGTGPWDIAIVRADPPRWIEFIPREEGGGVKDMNVPPTDPRCMWTNDESGNRVPPIATQFYDFVVVFLETREMIALSFKSSGIPVAKNLNSLMRLRQQRERIPFFWGKYRLTAVMTTGPKGTYAILKVANAGEVEDADLKLFLKDAFEGVKDKDLKIDRDQNPEDEGDSDDKPPF